MPDHKISDKVLHVIATSHLDTQWRWTFQDTINRYIPETLRANFALFEKFPNYVFSFEGAYRYMLAKMYWPDEYEKLKTYIQDGRWAVCGSVVDAGDQNTVSPESLIRQVLYGDGFFQDEFGKVSRDIFLPDCFGFGWIMPTIANHCGLLGFSTSKLEWGSSEGIPFNVGMWEGVDGSAIVACINPGQYSFPIKSDIREEEITWGTRIDETGDRCGAYVDFKYFGLGDTGGAPDQASVEFLEKGIAEEGSYRIVSAAADQLCRELTEEQKAKLPRHSAEFLLIEHGVGTYTSHGAMKKWNRRNEWLADAAERAAVIAEWLGGAEYPREKLKEAWVRFLANQMHDILPGTSIPEAYRFSWNDEIVSMNQFGSVLETSLNAVGSMLDTSWCRNPVVVYNPHSFDAKSWVEVGVPGLMSEDVDVIDSDGTILASQIVSRNGTGMRIGFFASVPSVGFAVYDVKESEGIQESKVQVLHDGAVLDSESMRVEIDVNGNISRVLDKINNCEILEFPVHFQFLSHGPKEWPAWTIIYDDISRDPVEVVAGPARFEILEEGPVRASVRVIREARGSVFEQTVRLVAGETKVEVENFVRWRSPGVVLKVAFPLAVSNPKATYDLGVGVIERGNNHEKLHEVPALQWADITDVEGKRGVAILSDSKYGWDKPIDNVLRLTALNTPSMTDFECRLGGADFVDHFLEQEALDFGEHRFSFAILSHEGNWKKADLPRKADLFNQPFFTWNATRHPGKLGKKFSFASVSNEGLAIRALKKAEKTDELVVRAHDIYGKDSLGEISFPAEVTDLREVNGVEEHIADIDRDSASIKTDFLRYRPRAFAFKLADSDHKISQPEFGKIELPFNLDAISLRDNPMDGDIDGEGYSLPGELLPEEIVEGGIPFTIGPKEYRAKNALVFDDQEIEIPSGKWNRLHLLAVSVYGDCEATINVVGEDQSSGLRRAGGTVV